MKKEDVLPWILFPLPAERQRGFSFSAAIASGFEPREYRSLLHEEPMRAEALLDFKMRSMSKKKQVIMTST